VAPPATARPVRSSPRDRGKVIQALKSSRVYLKASAEEPKALVLDGTRRSSSQTKATTLGSGFGGTAREEVLDAVLTGKFQKFLDDSADAATELPAADLPKPPPSRGLTLGTDARQRFHGSFSGKEVEEELRRVAMVLHDFTITKNSLWHLEDERGMAMEKIDQLEKGRIHNLETGLEKQSNALDALTNRVELLDCRVAALEDSNQKVAGLFGKVELLDARLLAREAMECGLPPPAGHMPLPPRQTGLHASEAPGGGPLAAPRPLSELPLQHAPAPLPGRDSAVVGRQSPGTVASRQSPGQSRRPLSAASEVATEDGSDGFSAAHARRASPPSAAAAATAVAATTAAVSGIGSGDGIGGAGGRQLPGHQVEGSLTAEAGLDALISAESVAAAHELARSLVEDFDLPPPWGATSEVAQPKDMTSAAQAPDTVGFDQGKAFDSKAAQEFARQAAPPPCSGAPASVDSAPSSSLQQSAPSSQLDLPTIKPSSSLQQPVVSTQSEVPAAPADHAPPAHHTPPSSLQQSAGPSSQPDLPPSVPSSSLQQPVVSTQSEVPAAPPDQAPPADLRPPADLTPPSSSQPSVPSPRPDLKSNTPPGFAQQPALSLQPLAAPMDPNSNTAPDSLLQPAPLSQTSPVLVDPSTNTPPLPSEHSVLVPEPGAAQAAPSSITPPGSVQQSVPSLQPSYPSQAQLNSELAAARLRQSALTPQPGGSPLAHFNSEATYGHRQPPALFARPGLPASAELNSAISPSSVQQPASPSGSEGGQPVYRDFNGSPVQWEPGQPGDSPPAELRPRSQQSVGRDSESAQIAYRNFNGSPVQWEPPQPGDSPPAELRPRSQQSVGRDSESARFSPVDWGLRPGETPELQLRPISEQSLRQESEYSQSIYVDSNGSIVDVGQSLQSSPSEETPEILHRPFSQQSLRADSQQSQSVYADSRGSLVDWSPSPPPLGESPELYRRPYSEQSLRPISEQARYDCDGTPDGWQALPPFYGESGSASGNEESSASGLWRSPTPGETPSVGESPPIIAPSPSLLSQPAESDYNGSPHGWEHSSPFTGDSSLPQVRPGSTESQPAYCDFNGSPIDVEQTPPPLAESETPVQTGSAE